MLPRFLAALNQHLVERPRLLPFLVECDDAFYGVAAALELALCHPLVDVLHHFLRQPQLNLTHQTTVNSTVYTTLKPFPEPSGAFCGCCFVFQGSRAAWALSLF